MALRFISDLAGTLNSYFKVGTVRLKDNSNVLEVKNAGDTAFATAKAHTLHVLGSNASNSVALTAPADLAGAVAFTLMGADGTNGQVVKTNGSGVLSFVDASSNGMLAQVEAFDQADHGTPVSIFTPPANSTILKIVVDVTTAYSTGSGSIAIGTEADPDAYMDELEVDLTTVAKYEVEPCAAAGGSPAAVLATVTADTATFGGNVYVYYGSPA
jgi:hypothetical protein